jgi:hypothetical protein
MQYRRQSTAPSLAQLAVVVFLFALIPLSAADAQRRRGIRETSSSQEQTRSGFWGLLGIGMGAQAFSVDGDAGYGSVLYQPTATLRLGGTVNPHLRVGVEGQVWVDAAGDQVESMASALLIGQWYPFSSAGLFVKGGAGIGRSGLDTADGFSTADIGFATSLGVGAELRMGKYMFLVPEIDWVFHTYQNRDAAGYRARVVNFGIALLFQG